MTAVSQPDFARLRRCLLREGLPDRVPLYEGVNNGVMSAWLGKPVSGLETTIEFRARAGYDYVTIGIDLWSALKKVKEGSRTRLPGSASKMGQYSVYTKTLQERVWVGEGQGVITSAKEFEDFPWPGPEEMDFSPFQKAEDWMPGGMKVVAAVGHAFTTVWTLMGLEGFCIALEDNPDLVDRMFRKVSDIQYEVLDRVTRFSSVGGVHIADDIAYTTGLMISPGHLRRYLFPILERMCALCRSRGIPVTYHSDGRLYDVLDDIVAVGFNALHPIQPNAMDIRNVKERVGDKLCLLGNIDLDVLTRGTPEQVEELVKKNLRDIAGDGGYCVGSSNSVPDFVPLANYNAMRETALKYGAYPIRI
ncbi:MAG: nucleoside 2-deoxyribosyltransferase [Chloroflexi bacterium]|nr:nucleoside 2-deoxyribosyltransferase [Chloroflexota bacterium]